MRRRFSFISMPRLCAIPRSPMKSPVATSTGITGTKTSPRVRETFCSGDICSYASCFPLPAVEPRFVPATKAS